MLARPGPDEYFEFYRTYVAKVPDGDIIDTLSHQGDRLRAMFSEVPRESETFAYAPGKWTVREVLGHIIDAERVFAYRALSIGRGDETPLPGFDENEWAARSNAGSRDLASIVEEFGHVRSATCALFGSFGAGVGRRTGVASGHGISVRALAWIVAGHAEHHLRLIQERYLPAMEAAAP